MPEAEPWRGSRGRCGRGAVLYSAGVRGWAGEDRGRVGPGAARSLTELCSHPQGYPGAGQAGPYSGGPYGGGAAPGQPYGAPPAGPYGGAAPGGERGAVLRGRRPRAGLEPEPPVPFLRRRCPPGGGPRGLLLVPGGGR